MNIPKGFKKRGEYWHVDRFINGVRRRVSTGQRDLEAAIAWASTSDLVPNTKNYRASKRDLLRLLDSARARARLSGEPFTITAEDLNVLWRRGGGRCEMTGLQFSRQSINGCRRAPYKPSLDRIKRGAGYTPENVRLVCVWVNAALNEWGEEVFKTMVAAFRNHQGKFRLARQ